MVANLAFSSAAETVVEWGLKKVDQMAFSWVAGSVAGTVAYWAALKDNALGSWKAA